MYSRRHHWHRLCGKLVFLELSVGEVDIEVAASGCQERVLDARTTHKRKRHELRSHGRARFHMNNTHY